MCQELYHWISLQLAQMRNVDIIFMVGKTITVIKEEAALAKKALEHQISN